jgi:SAM-dependent methyltransferase
VELMREYAEPPARVLEVGCNAGRNLEALRQAGYDDLTGIEINSDALALLRTEFPPLAERATLLNAPLEEVAPTLPERSFDAVFTMAVLEHIHPESEWTFAHIADAARRVLITIEDERRNMWRAFARNYSEVFAPFGLVEEKAFVCGPEHGLDDAFVARVLVRRG